MPAKKKVMPKKKAEPKKSDTVVCPRALVESTTLFLKVNHPMATVEDAVRDFETSLGYRVKPPQQQG